MVRAYDPERDGYFDPYAPPPPPLIPREDTRTQAEIVGYGSKYNGWACPLCRHEPQYAKGPCTRDVEIALVSHVTYAHRKLGDIRRHNGEWDCPLYDCQLRLPSYHTFRKHCEKNHLGHAKARRCKDCPQTSLMRYKDGLSLVFHREKHHKRALALERKMASEQRMWVRDEDIIGDVEQLLRQERAQDERDARDGVQLPLPDEIESAIPGDLLSSSEVDDVREEPARKRLRVVHLEIVPLEVKLTDASPTRETGWDGDIPTFD